MWHHCPLIIRAEQSDSDDLDQTSAQVIENVLGPNLGKTFLEDRLSISKDEAVKTRIRNIIGYLIHDTASDSRFKPFDDTKLDPAGN